MRLFSLKFQMLDFYFGQNLLALPVLTFQNERTALNLIAHIQSIKSSGAQWVALAITLLIDPSPSEGYFKFPKITKVN